ncbi:MAG: hypothetical protein ACJASZ_001047, partial [Yoonia sp.]
MRSLHIKPRVSFLAPFAIASALIHDERIAYPILILNGEQGSAKSTTARVLRNLIDPANPIARSAPNSEQDLVIAAKHNHVLAFDNLSTIKPMMADAFCRIATGGGFGTRKLHTDSEEMLFSATRPCLLNGIP